MSYATNIADKDIVKELTSLSARAGLDCFTWSLNVKSDPVCLKYEVVDANGMVLGSGLMPEEAVELAQRAVLRTIPLHHQTYKEFSGNALVIEMAVNRPASGQEDAVNELRQELTSLYYRNPAIHTSAVRPGQWVENGIANLLTEPLRSGMRLTTIEGGKTLVLAHPSMMQPTLLRKIHESEIEAAILNDQIVPYDVVVDYQYLVDLTIALARQSENFDDEIEQITATERMQ